MCAAYSGLYSYHVPSSTWTLLKSDAASGDGNVPLRSRIGHSMLFHPKKSELHIMAGQRAKDYLADHYVYSIATGEVQEISRDYSKFGGLEPGFTQRATLDPDTDEIYVLCGLTKDKSSANESAKSSLWALGLKKSKWTKVYQNENVSAEYWDKMKDVEPCPRYAHQLVYDPNMKRFRH
jgi:hypothetical protein